MFPLKQSTLKTLSLVGLKRILLSLVELKRILPEAGCALKTIPDLPVLWWMSRKFVRQSTKFQANLKQIYIFIYISAPLKWVFKIICVYGWRLKVILPQLLQLSPLPTEAGAAEAGLPRTEIFPRAVAEASPSNTFNSRFLALELWKINSHGLKSSRSAWGNW